MLHMLRGQKRLSWFGCGYAALWHDNLCGLQLSGA